MRLRNIWGGELFLFDHTDPSGVPAPVPGAGEAAQGNQSDLPPSGATTPVSDDSSPGPIPYARFQEVNNQRRELSEAMEPYRALEDSGYGAADLERLATWEQEYMQDPVGTWLRQAEQIEGLPDAVKAAISAAGESAGSTQGTPTADGVSPQTPTAPQDEELRQRLATLEADHQTRQQREQEEAISAFYDGLVSAWKQIDQEQGIVTPDESIHAHLAAASPNAASAEEILRSGRESYLVAREAILQSAIKRPGGDGTVPRTVPGSGAGGSAPPVRPRTLAEARKAAMADPMFQGQQ